MGIASELDLHHNLRARLHQVHAPPNSNKSNNNGGFVLYLPTVCLRYEQNPSFAVACHAANRLAVPLIVLAVVVDDASHASSSTLHRHPPVSSTAELSSSVAMTSRRLAFTLQALSHACKLWSQHGAAVGIRIHGASSSQYTINPQSTLFGNTDNNAQAINTRTIKGARTPDHLTLATRSLLVVTDEPFVSPYLTLVQKVEEACRKSHVECIRVDGSCTVPPVQVLKRVPNKVGGALYRGVPSKAYQWQNQTEHLREGHLKAAMEGHFDAPSLIVTMEDEDLFTRIPSASVSPASQSSHGSLSLTANNIDAPLEKELTTGQRLAHLFPSRWKPPPSNNGNHTSTAESNGHSDVLVQASLPSAPDVRPFTSRELSQLYHTDDWSTIDSSLPQQRKKQQSQKEEKDAIDNSSSFAQSAPLSTTIPQQSTPPSSATAISATPFHNFALNWPGADPTVPPCPHTIGTTTMGMHRWNTWIQSNGLSRYGKTRNDATNNIHGVSRMSCYLNLGIVSIFRIVWEVKRLQSKGGTVSSSSRNSKSGADKFEEEIVKWREMSYAHSFSRLDYDDIGSLAPWSVQFLNNRSGSSNINRNCYTLEQLANGTTGNGKWDAMQQYLVTTGELHNNVRMTWGKTVVEWGGCGSRGQGDTLMANNSTCSTPAHVTLRTLCYLNDRYALDGLSPPSYAGVLWCMGWCDKPATGGTISLKPAHRYRMTSEEFRDAERKLMAVTCGGRSSLVGGSGSFGTSGRRQQSVLGLMKKTTASSSHGSPTNNKCSADFAEAVVGEKHANSDIISNKETKNQQKKGGLKRNGSFTIDSFFQRTPKKTAKENEKQIIG